MKNRDAYFIRPAHKGLIVRDPHTMTPLPESGALVTWNTYWRRQLAQGSIIVGEVQAPAPVVDTKQTDEKKSFKGGAK